MIMAGTITDTSTFESDLDGWTTDALDEPFLRRSGSTPVRAMGYGTGPTGAAVGSYYVYAHADYNSNDKFDLQKTFPAGQELYGIAFQYHMYGSYMGSGVLESSADGTSWASLWSKSFNQGDQWHQAAVYAQGSGQTMLRYVYTTQSQGTAYLGDFALDDIQIGDCLTVGCSASPNSDCMAPGGTCDAATGRCSAYADGTACGAGGTCLTGVCTGACGR